MNTLLPKLALAAVALLTLADVARYHRRSRSGFTRKAALMRWEGEGGARAAPRRAAPISASAAESGGG
jgi:hypothetical protein